jgi:hypothetical protein
VGDATPLRRHAAQSYIRVIVYLVVLFSTVIGPLSDENEPLAPQLVAIVPPSSAVSTTPEPVLRFSVIRAGDSAEDLARQVAKGSLILKLTPTIVNLALLIAGRVPVNDS